jgi:hypothetical protein
MAKVIFNNQPQNHSVSAEYFKQLVCSNNSLLRGLVRAEEGVKYRRTLRTLDAPVSFQDASCDFNPPSTGATIGGRVLEVVPFEMHRKLCMEDLRLVLQNSELPLGSINDYIGTTELQEAIANRYGELASVAINKLMWLGKSGATEFSALTASFDGFLPAMIADANVITVTAPQLLNITGLTLGTTTTVTHASNANNLINIGDIVTFSNSVDGTTQIRGLSGRVLSKTATTTVVDVNSTGFTPYTSGGTLNGVNVNNIKDTFARMLTAIPECVRNSNKVQFLVSGKIFDDYLIAEALAGGNATAPKTSSGVQKITIPFQEAEEQTLQETITDYLGIPIRRMHHWLPNVILAAIPDNLRVGYDLLDDFNTLDIKWLGETTMDYNYGVRMSMKLGVQYVFSNEITILKPAL